MPVHQKVYMKMELQQENQDHVIIENETGLPFFS